MTFPSVSATATSHDTTTTSHVVTLPTGYAAGDLLFILIGAHNVSPGVQTPSGWTALLVEESGTSGQNLAIFWKIASGSEGSSVTVASTNGAGSNSITVAVTTGTFDSSQAPVISSTGLGSSTTPDPPNLAPSWGSADNLFIAVASGPEASSGTGVTAYPTSYSLNQINSNGQGGAATPRVGMAARDLTASSDDPAAFTFSFTSNWVAVTIAVKPLAAANVTPTGVSVTTSAGSLVGTEAVTILGVGVTSHAGSLVPTDAKVFVGVGIAAAAGLLGIVEAKTFVGVGIAAAAGIPSNELDLPFSGAGVVAYAGTINAAASSVSGAGVVTYAGDFSAVLVGSLIGAQLTAAAGSALAAFPEVVVGVSLTSYAGAFHDAEALGFVGAQAVAGAGHFFFAIGSAGVVAYAGTLAGVDVGSLIGVQANAYAGHPWVVGARKPVRWVQTFYH